MGNNPKQNDRDQNSFVDLAEQEDIYRVLLGCKLAYLNKNYLEENAIFIAKNELKILRVIEHYTEQEKKICFKKLWVISFILFYFLTIKLILRYLIVFS